jgi:hypothetical protein
MRALSRLKRRPEARFLDHPRSRVFSPTANWNGTNWMVAWDSESYARLVAEVHLARVAPDGIVLDDPAKVLDTSPTRSTW